MKVNLIRFPLDGEARIKKIISRSNTKPTGKYPSWKMGRMIHWEHIDQLNLFRLLDINPAINSFAESPMEIQYEMDGRIYCEYPDVLITSGNQKEIWKIKKSNEEAVMTTSNCKSFGEQLLEKGFRWRIVDADSLRLEPRNQNTITLLKYGKTPINLVEKEKIRNYLTQYKTISWGEVITGVIGPSGPRNICHLVMEGDIYFDINQIWSSGTLFYWNDIHSEKPKGNRL